MSHVFATNIESLKQRAALLTKIREFFANRNILEVETPLLAHGTITDPNIHSFKTIDYLGNTFYLQTSPEFCMKRLLAADSGSIYQICKAFRDEENGEKHNQEFTILEWYHVGFDHYQLMREVDELLQFVLKTARAEMITYKELFYNHFKIDPLLASVDDLREIATKNGLNITAELLNKDDYLNLLLTHFIEPNLGTEKPLFIYNYPASQAALAKIDGNIAERFEVYFRGVELANGFHELANAKEQRSRFVNDLEKRQQLNLPTPPLDERFLAAIDFLPNCAGVALGVDRLLMLLSKQKSIKHCLLFPSEIA